MAQCGNAADGRTPQKPDPELASLLKQIFPTPTPNLPDVLTTLRF